MIFSYFCIHKIIKRIKTINYEKSVIYLIGYCSFRLL